eukprot:1723262-Pleurochrysis_carterae.AAC.1
MHSRDISLKVQTNALAGRQMPSSKEPVESWQTSWMHIQNAAPSTKPMVCAGTRAGSSGRLDAKGSELRVQSFARFAA